MNGAATYEKEYFTDNYAAQFEALRAEYRARTREALQGRRIDKSPVSNVDAVVYLHEDQNGGYNITTGDFMEFFNRRFGGSDRIGAMQRSIANAVRRDELRREVEERRGTDAVQKKQTHVQPLRSVRPRFAFMQVILALMLVFSVCILGVSALLVDRSEAELMLLEEEAAMLEATRGVAETDQYDADSTGNGVYADMSGEDTVEIYPAENGGGVQMAALLNALANLGR
ncbi:MAG: hypothetical protein E7590_05605 [Ruminococcaceae bacterium]|nr:hypothetical protein [Oscillospiraceae bacterium]